MDLAGNSSPEKSASATKAAGDVTPAVVEEKAEASRTSNVDAVQTSTEAAMDTKLAASARNEEAADRNNGYSSKGGEGIHQEEEKSVLRSTFTYQAATQSGKSSLSSI